MGILTRFTDIMKSNINALLDKCEDPAKMIDQTLRDLREDLAEVKKETANIIADAKSADRQVKECEEEIAKYTTAAQNALKAGNEDDARTLIAKKQQYESNLVSYKKTQELTHANADKMRQMHDKLVNDIETLEAITYCEDCKGQYRTIDYGKTCPYCHSEHTYLLKGNEFNIKEIGIYEDS